MKNIMSVLSFLMLYSTICEAQIQKGAILLGGDVSYNGQSKKEEFSQINYLTFEEYNSNYFAIRPQIGSFISSNTLLGIGLSYEHERTKHKVANSGNSTPYEWRENMVFINPYLEKYLKISNQFYFTLQFNLMAGFGNVKEGENNEEILKLSELRVNISPGLAYFISEKLALTCNVGQIYYNRKTEHLVDDSNDDNLKNIDQNYGLSVNFNTFSLGLQYFLKNKGE